MTPAGNAGSGYESGLLGTTSPSPLSGSQETRRGIKRMRNFGTTIFSEMTSLAVRTGAGRSASAPR